MRVTKKRKGGASSMVKMQNCVTYTRMKPFI